MTKEFVCFNGISIIEIVRNKRTLESFMHLNNRIILNKI